MRKTLSLALVATLLMVSLVLAEEAPKFTTEDAPQWLIGTSLNMAKPVLAVLPESELWQRTGLLVICFGQPNRHFGPVTLSAFWPEDVYRLMFERRVAEAIPASGLIFSFNLGR